MKQVVLIFCALFFVGSGILAQEDVKTAKYENVTWHRFVLANYKPGKV